MRQRNSFAQPLTPWRNRSLCVEHLEARLVPGETLTGLLFLPVGLLPVEALSGQAAVVSDAASTSVIMESWAAADRRQGLWLDAAEGGGAGESGTLSLCERPASDGQTASVHATINQPTETVHDLPVHDVTPMEGLGGIDWDFLPAVVSRPAPKSFAGETPPANGTTSGADLAGSAPVSSAGSIETGGPAEGAVGGDVGPAAGAATGAAAASPMLHAQPERHGAGVTGGPRGYSPAQIRHAYGFDKLPQNGAGVTIAIVDAYDAPNITADLNTFSTQFGLPTTTSGSFTFTKAFAQGSRPAADGGWAQETSLDVEWAHAIAPRANILLVEAANNSFANLFGAVDYAVNHGASIVSMSWGASDFAGEASFDYHFNKPGVTFLAAAGDVGGQVIYPSSSPFVVSVGGTTLPLDSGGNLIGPETVWSSGGGGASANEAMPGYQSSYGLTGGKRSTPDVSYDANPSTGFAVYDSYSYFGQQGWLVFGGTSARAPQWAGLVALANQGRTPLSSNNLKSSPLYNAATGASVYASNYRDITSGSNGRPATTGYDLATGLGSPLANNLVPYLKTH